MKCTITDADIFQKDILERGFELTKHYEHDEWETMRFVKECLHVEFTYTLGLEKVESIDVTIDEAIGIPVKLSNVIDLDRILNKQLN